MVIKDQLNRNVLLETTPKRIVSLVPSQTELLVDLGLEEQLVGVTKFCVHPEHLRKSKTVVGGTKSVKLEKIKNLHPDIILCNKEENTKDMILQLETIAPVHISDVCNIETSLELIEMYGDIFNKQEDSQDLIRDISTLRRQFSLENKERTSPKVAYFIWKDPWMVVANDTFINAMLKEAGFHNVFAQMSRYPEIYLQNSSLLEEAEMILLSSEPFPFNNDHLNYLKSLFPNKMIKTVDGEMFSWFGSRVRLSYAYFRTLIS